MAEQIEERDATLEQVKAGLKLKAGHKVKVIVSDAHAPPAPAKAEDPQGGAEPSQPAKPASQPDPQQPDPKRSRRGPRPR